MIYIYIDIFQTTIFCCLIQTTTCICQCDFAACLWNRNRDFQTVCYWKINTNCSMTEFCDNLIYIIILISTDRCVGLFCFILSFSIGWLVSWRFKVRTSRLAGQFAACHSPPLYLCFLSLSTIALKNNVSSVISENKAGHCFFQQIFFRQEEIENFSGTIF